MTAKNKSKKYRKVNPSNTPYKQLPEIKYSSGDLVCPNCGKSNKANCPTCGGPGTPWLI